MKQKMSCRIGDKLLECKLDDFECLTCGDQFDGCGPDMEKVRAAAGLDTSPAVGLAPAGGQDSPPSQDTSR